MKERWVDCGNGIFKIETDTLYCRISSRAKKNYRREQSHWYFYFYVKGQYGYMARIYCDFCDTMEGAMNRAETIMIEMFVAIQEII